MSSVEIAVRGFLDRWVHPAAADDPQDAERNRSLVASLLALSLFGAGALPLWVAMVGAFTVRETIFFAATTAPLLIAGQLARTGDIARATIFFAALLAGFAVLVSKDEALLSLAFLALVAFEGATAGSRRVLAACLGLALAGAVLVMFAPPVEVLAAGDLKFLALGAAGITAASSAMRIWNAHRHALARAHESEHHYKIFADAIGGLVTVHDSNGDTTFVSPASRNLLGVSPSEIAGGRFATRIQVSDRVNFLNAMKGCVRDRKDGLVMLRMLRVRRGSGGRAILETTPMEMHYRPQVNEQTGEVSVIAVTRDQITTEKPRPDVSSLREPLKAIVEFSGLLSNRAPVPANSNAAPDYAHLIRAAAAQMLDAVNESAPPGRTATASSGRPNGRFLSAATKSVDQMPADSSSGHDGRMKVFFPDLARASAGSRPIGERRGG